MNILTAAKARHTTKAFDPQRTLAPELLATLCGLLRHSPSSVNSQPWHFIVATTNQGKARLARGTSGGYAFNAAKVQDAAAVLLLCARTDMDAPYTDTLLKQEQHDGRFQVADAMTGQQKGRASFIALHRDERRDLQAWMEKQVYLALGTLLLGAATLEVDACPMEGFDAAILDREFDLAAQGLTSVVMVSLGYRSERDFNAGLPKSRLTDETLFTYL